MANPMKVHGEGNFQLKIQEANEIEFRDFVNPWTFHHLFIGSDETVYSWLRNNGLLANEVTCRTCGTPAKLKKRQKI